MYLFLSFDYWKNFGGIMAFIIDSYNRFDKWDFEHAVHIFEVNGGWYAIYRVQLEWGLPILPLRLEK